MVPSITARDLSYSYFAASRPALQSCSFTVQPGSCCAVLGPSGAGKTTLLQVLSGIAGSQITTSAATGSLVLGDREFTPIPRHALFPMVGFCMADSLVQLSGVKNTVADEIGFTLNNLGITGSEYSSRLDNILDKFKLATLADRHPGTLSGGELRRLMLASIMVGEPSILLLDEPVSSLDSTAESVLASVIQSSKKNMTVVMADHQVDFALRVADQIVVLDGGAVVFDGSTKDFLSSLPDFEHLLPTGSWQELMAAEASSNLRPSIRRMIRP